MDTSPVPVAPAGAATVLRKLTTAPGRGAASSADRQSANPAIKPPIEGRWTCAKTWFGVFLSGADTISFIAIIQPFRERGDLAIVCIDMQCPSNFTRHLRTMPPIIFSLYDHSL